MDWWNRLQTLLSPAAAKELGTGTEGYVQEDKSDSKPFDGRELELKPRALSEINAGHGYRNTGSYAKRNTTVTTETPEEIDKKKKERREKMLDMSKQFLSNFGKSATTPEFKQTEINPVVSDLVTAFRKNTGMMG